MTTQPRFEVGSFAALTLSEGAVLAVRILQRESREPHAGIPMWFYRVDAVATWPDGNTSRWVLDSALAPSENHALKANDATLGAPIVGKP
jgi:hypothetical protein